MDKYCMTCWYLKYAKSKDVNRKVIKGYQWLEEMRVSHCLMETEFLMQLIKFWKWMVGHSYTTPVKVLNVTELYT